MEKPFNPYLHLLTTYITYNRLPSCCNNCTITPTTTTTNDKKKKKKNDDDNNNGNNDDDDIGSTPVGTGFQKHRPDTKCVVTMDLETTINSSPPADLTFKKSEISRNMDKDVKSIEIQEGLSWEFLRTNMD